MRLEAADRPAERVALLGVGGGQRRARPARCRPPGRRCRCARRRASTARCACRRPARPEPLAGRGLEREVGGRGGVQAHLLLLARDAEARGAAADDEGAQARSGSRAKTRNVWACEPLVIHCLVPVSRAVVGAGAHGAGVADRCPTRSARRRASSWPWASGGTSRLDLLGRCRWPASGSVPALVCTATVTPTPASAREAPRGPGCRTGSRRPRRRARPARRRPSAPARRAARRRPSGTCARGPSPRRAARSPRRRSAARGRGSRAARRSARGGSSAPPRRARVRPPPTSARAADGRRDLQPAAEPLEAHDVPALLARDARQLGRRG